jgi:two-component system sensor histidine kinase/response regulator
MRQAYAAGSGFRLAIIDGRMPGMDGFELAKRIREDPQLADAVIMMLTSTDQSGDAARCRQLGIARYLVKPIRKSELLSAVLATLGQPVRAPATPPAVHEKAEQGSHGLQILLVEDNPVNHTVGLRMLQKMGHVVALAKNGKEALERIAKNKFDLVFMDVQMPEMDGLTATRHIRASERLSGRHQRIIAMTARAMRGDREVCLAAGMDGYISKPIAREELESAIQQYAGEIHPSAGPSETAIPPPASGWDARVFLEKIGGDESLLREVTDILLEETPKLIARLRKAVETADAETLETTAHSLKGELSYLGSSAADHARELEKMGRDKKLDRAAELLSAFEEEIRSLLEEVRKGVRGDSAHAG